MPIAVPCIAKRWSSKDTDNADGFGAIVGVASASGSIVRDTVGSGAVVSTKYVSGRWVILLHAQMTTRNEKRQTRHWSRLSAVSPFSFFVFRCRYSASASDANRICSSSGDTP
jgi:hypothetical protein